MSILSRPLPLRDPCRARTAAKGSGSRTRWPPSSRKATTVPSFNRNFFRRAAGITICPLELITAVAAILAYLLVRHILLSGKPTSADGIGSLWFCVPKRNWRTYTGRYDFPAVPFSASELSAAFAAGTRGVMRIRPITVSNDTASSPYSTNLSMALTLPVRTASQPAAPFAAPNPSIRPIRVPHERLRLRRPSHPASELPAPM